MVEEHQADGITTITLRPNRSASWQETRVAVLIICSTTMIIGLFWAFIGAWMVLPFSGLEAALVAWLFYRVCQSTYQRQVITCAPDSLTVQFGTHFPKRSWQLEKARARVSIDEPRHALDAPTLMIADTTHSIELGKFLNKEDKQLAVQAFRRAGMPVRQRGEHGSTTL
jgi:uncharacterized membrane protein